MKQIILLHKETAYLKGINTIIECSTQTINKKQCWKLLQVLK